MSTTSVSGVRADEASGNRGNFGEARWLAAQDIRRSWLSYPVSAGFMFFTGLLGASLINGVVTIEGTGDSGADMAAGFNIFFADYFFLLMGCLLVVNALSQEYTKVWVSDVFSERATFLRSLPLSTQTLVFGRVISMLVAAPLNTVAFFLPAYLLTDLGSLGLSYLWFVGMWLGWGILYSGVTLLCEFGMSGRMYCWASFVLVAVYAAVLIVLELVFGLALIPSTTAIAGTAFGPITALASIAVGFVGLWFLAKLTVRRIHGREVGS